MTVRDRAGETDDAEHILAVEDRLELVGIAGGLFVALVGVGTLVGMPWAHHDSLAITVGRVLGTLGTIAVGLAIVWLARTR